MGRLPLEAPIVVIGDKSGSMEVAIRTSTIIASLLTAITSARLVFFNTENHDAAFIPETVEQVSVCNRRWGGSGAEGISLGIHTLQVLVLV